MQRFSIQFALLLIVILAASGCSLFKTDSSIIRTKIVPAPFGDTTATPEFKANRQMPRGHIIWGNDVQPGAKCVVVITNATKAQQVYRHEFIYTPTALGGGYNFTNGLVVENDGTWNRLLGQYIIELFVNGRSISNSYFKIIP
ncbi:MAG: hypothetical protein ACYC9O_20055 [Candidatus Latescibacterota bacterium]